jgi:hypothetical protein
MPVNDAEGLNGQSAGGSERHWPIELVSAADVSEAVAGCASVADIAINDSATMHLSVFLIIAFFCIPSLTIRYLSHIPVISA